MEQFGVLTPKLALRLAAPHTWPASVCPALLGEFYCLLSGYPMSAAEGVALLFSCILMQSAVNTFNDFFDYVKGTDSEEDCVDASDSVLVYEHVKPVHALLLGAGFLVAAGVIVLPLLLTAGMAPIAVGAVGCVVVILYSGGPVPLSYLPVGELVSGFVMGGLIPLGILAALTGMFHWSVLAASLPLILGIGLIMMTNNSCDIEKDVKAGRRTLPVLLGRRHAVWLYRAVVLFWIVLLCVLPLFLLGLPGLLCPVLVCLVARRSFQFLLTSPLVQLWRIKQMKGILKANMLGNGAYLVTLVTTLLMGGTLHV